ncbi:MAG: cation transporter [Candidatus Zixiibacteriota bacterium]|nr:MAG: cation transporter [candidate division Zixibacteria bacterium]
MATFGVPEEQLRKDTRAGLTVTWVGCGVNIFLVITKIAAGLTVRSQALVADGVHSLSDLFSDFVVILGLKLGRKEEDENHPFGHARIETISGMLVGAILLVVGAGIAYNALASIYEHRLSTPGALAIVVAAASIVLKEVMYWYTIKVGRRIKSLAVIGNAWHHRTDALSSIAVLIGVTAAYVNPAWHQADAYAALIVTVFIFRVGGGLTWGALKQVVDTAPDRRTLDQLVEIALKVEGVEQVHDVRARYSGQQIFVEMHIVVDPDLTVRQGHDIADVVRFHLVNEIADVTRVIIHVDPD